MNKPNSMKMTVRNDFFNKKAREAQEHGSTIIQLRPKGATIEETIEAMNQRGLIARTGTVPNMVFVMTEDGLMDRVNETIKMSHLCTRAGGFLVVKKPEGHLRMSDFRKWAKLNGFLDRLVSDTLYIYCKAAA